MWLSPPPPPTKSATSVIPWATPEVLNLSVFCLLLVSSFSLFHPLLSLQSQFAIAVGAFMGPPSEPNAIKATISGTECEIKAEMVSSQIAAKTEESSRVRPKLAHKYVRGHVLVVYLQKKCFVREFLEKWVPKKTLTDCVEYSKFVMLVLRHFHMVRDWPLWRGMPPFQQPIPVLSIQFNAVTCSPFAARIELVTVDSDEWTQFNPTFKKRPFPKMEVELGELWLSCIEATLMPCQSTSLQLR